MANAQEFYAQSEIVLLKHSLPGGIIYLTV